MMRSETVKFAVILFIFAGLAGLALSGAFRVTQERIAQNDGGVERDALNAVLPAHDNDPFADAFAWEKYRNALLAASPQLFPAAGDPFWQEMVYPAKQGAAYNGAALQVSKTGYGGAVQTAIGVDGDGNLVSIRIVAMAQETPGLGTKVAEPDFLTRVQFADVASRTFRTLANTPRFAVDKDGGSIAAITGATISSRAVVDAVGLGMQRLAALWQLPAAATAPTGTAPAAPAPAAAPATAPDAHSGATREGHR